MGKRKTHLRFFFFLGEGKIFLKKKREKGVTSLRKLRVFDSSFFSDSSLLWGFFFIVLAPSRGVFECLILSSVFFFFIMFGR